MTSHSYITEPGITELADFRTDDGADFEAAMEELKGVLASSPGYKSHRVIRSIETPGRYVLLVEWESVEDHMVGFRQSERFGEWAGRIARHREGVFVEHFEQVLEHRLDQNRQEQTGTHER